MKNFKEINRTFTVKKNLLIFKSSFCEKLKLIIIPFLLLTLGVGQMWADNAGFWDTGAGIITYSKNGGSDTNHSVNKTGASTSDFGTVTAFWLKGWQIKMWKNSSGNICDYGKLYYRIYLTSGSGGSFTELNKASTTWGDNTYHNGGSLNTNLLSGLVGGTYYFEFYFKAQGNWSSSSGCDDKYLSNGSSNYKIKFKYDPKYTVTVSAGSNGSVASTSVTAGNIDAVTLPTATANTGYHFVNWTTASSNLTLGSTTSATGGTVKARAAATVTANFAANTYTVAYNANDAQYPGTATGSTSSSSHTYGTAKTLTSNGFSRSGYSFAGWATSPTGEVTYTDGQSVSNLTSTHKGTVTLYAKWTENMSDVTLVADPEGKGTFTIGGAAATSTTAGVTTTRSVTAVPIAGYSFDSWSISGGASISSTSTNPTTVTGGGAGTAATLTATFVENPVYYDVTFGVGTSYTSLGSLSATNNTTSSSISSGDDLLSASSVTFTASPNTGYVVEGWYTDAACTEGKHDAGSTTYTIASLSSDVTVYVKFVEKTWSVAFAAGTGGTVTTPAATPQTVGQLTGISIAATPGTGYTFNTWTITSGSGSFTSAATTNSNTFKPTAASTITASFNETKSTITVTTATSSQGTLTFGSTSKSWGATASLGVATTQSITATAAAGFRFVRWDLSGAAASSSTLTNTTITLKADGSGSTGTATAVFEEDLSSPWIVAGGNKIVTTGTTWRTESDANNTMLKKTGHSTESVVYFTVPVTTVCSGDPNTNFQFKIYNTSTSKWYGLFASGSYYLLKAEDGTEKSLVEDNQNIELRAYVTGNYELKLDYSTSTPKLTVTWPVYNQVRISAASPSDAGNVGNYDLSDPVSNVRSVKRTLKANTTYTFKIMYNSDWYGFNSGTFTRSNSTSSNSRTISTSGGNMTLTTDYAGDYTFKFNQSTKALSIDFPAAYKITFGKGSVDGTTGSFSAVNLSNGNSAVTSNSTWVKSGHNVKITAPSAKTGYRLLGWYDNNSATGDAITTNANCTITVNTTKTVYACYTPKQSAITLDKQTSATGYYSPGTVSTSPGSATYGSAMPTLSGTMPTAAAGYKFMGFYDATGGGGTKYYNADGSSARNWDKDKTTGTTLYAYYKKAEITALTFDAASVEASGEVGVTPTIDPVPEPTVSVCWRVLYDNDNPLSPQPEISWDGTKATFTAPAASGTYKVEAKLYNTGSCGSGTLLSTRVANFTVAGIHTVTVQYKCGEDDIKASTTTTGRPFDWSDAMTAPDIFGYTFSNWTAGTGVTLTDDNGTTTKTTTTNATIKIKATYNGTLTANYTQKSIIYFKNTLGWSDVYVNFYTTSDWDSSDNGSGSQKGAGNNGVTNRNKHMTQIGSTDVWYYDYGYNDGGSSITPSLYVSFTSASQNNVNEFWATNPGIGVVYPANYPDAISTDKSSENGFKAATPMFVPLATQDAVAINVGGGGKANYYNAGYWTKYLPGTGYTLEIYNSGGSYLKSAEFTSGDELMPMKAVVDLEAGQTYKYQLRRGGTDSYGIYYGNSGTMTYSNHGQGTAWEMINTMAGGFQKAGITTNAAGNYTFNLSYAANASTQYRLRMEVDYPVASDDYRVIYKHTGQARYKASAIVQKVNNGKDTVSFFIKPGSSPSMKIQRATVAANGTVTWNDYSTITSSVSGLAKDSVYNICLTMNESGAISVENVEVYTGNFYIRTDAANSKWDNYRSDPDHLMTYSEYSIEHGGYSHYYCHWVQAGTNRKNVKFCIANDYSPSISDTLARETASGTWANIASFISEGGDILRNANVRFTWNQHDNTISRAYVDGAQEDGSRFLVISSTDGKIQKADGSALSNNEVTFSDNENWIYEANVRAQPKAAYKLISTWGTGGTVITQYFKGTSGSTETLIDGSGTDWYDIRLLYDFKTNRLVAAWVPSDATITVNNAINADVMFIREHQGDIAQLTFGASGKISAIKTAYGVLKFNKWTLANKDKSTHNPLGTPASVYERSLFWISFPFRVKLSEVFGFGTYGTHWAIQRYDGAKRAEIGHFAENGSFWRWMNRNTEYLEPNQGYLLAIDLDLLGESSDVWGPESRSEQIELYFPSYGTMPNISNASVAQTIPTHTCTINMHATNPDLPDTGDPRTSYNRTIFDSHWNVLSVPTYVNTTAVSYANTTWTAAIGPKFLYTWNASDNTITATTASGYTYHAMHSYMVQYGGNLTWTASSGSPASIVARKTYAETPKEVEFRLELQQNEQEIDRTFVVLSNDEEVSADFQFGEDMTKEFNAKKSAIYTFIADEAVAAGNTLPMSEQTTVVPVGVDIKADGDYTFAMPDGTSGVGVVLIDNETGIRTSLSALDYTVFLEAGTYDKRFMMEISPIKQGTTGIDLINGDASANGVRKLLIDQKMYIIKGDKMYDATGRRIE